LLEAGSRLTGLAAFFPLAILGILALIGGMVLIVFTRTVGVALSGEPRTLAAAKAHEAGWRMVGPMAVLGGLCLFCGLFPALLMGPVSRVSELIAPGLPHLLTEKALAPFWLGWLGWGMVVCFALAAAWSRWLNSLGQAGSVPTWGCGYAFPTSRMSYSAEGFTELAETSLLCKCLQPEVQGGRSTSLFPKTATFRHRAPDPVLDSWYHPLFDWVAVFCISLRRLQSGSVPLYLFYMFITMGLFLAWVVIR
ncbi:MAG: hypothetical protein PHI97_34310, partial [Desulfobulbus sp.]|nr:hypothetical protein [Desulfobulbus sp.]